jgi:hypothetical protein
MKWTEKDFEKIKELLNKGLTYEEIAKELNRTYTAIKLKVNKLGLFYSPTSRKEEKVCAHCGKQFECFIRERRKYCTQSCSASKNNRIRVRRDARVRERTTCVYCGKRLTKYQNKFCSHNCQRDLRKKEMVEKIEQGDPSVDFRQYKKYLIEKYGEACMECGWNKKNPVTQNVPIELEHIDGNSENNNLNNLKLLCPNCHSLTPTYKALNVGNGREWRRKQKINVDIKAR